MSLKISMLVKLANVVKKVIKLLVISNIYCHLYWTKSSVQEKQLKMLFYSLLYFTLFTFKLLKAGEVLDGKSS